MMHDEMFFSDDGRLLRRGRRVAARTETCRPCLLWPQDAPEIPIQGVVMDVNPHGMLVRMLDSVPPGTSIMVQLMRDESFSDPLARPREGRVVRHADNSDGFVDHGVRLVVDPIKRVEEMPPIRIEPRKAPQRPGRSRMHLIDFTVGDRGSRRTNR
jgi:hypothetical protein